MGSRGRGLLGLTISVVLITSGTPTAFVAPVAAATSSAGLRVSGNHLVNAAGDSVRLTGVNRSGSEYMCIQDRGFFEGPSDAASVQAIADWHTNAVRVPLNEDCWLGINGAPAAFSGASYQQAIADYVALLKSKGLAAILELHWSAAGTDPATGQQPMPNRDHSVTFWSQVASAFRGEDDVAFDLFNEPFPDNNQDTTAAWQCWRDGGNCPGVSFEAAGMQELVNAVRATGATNVILLGGVRYANALSQWLAYKPVDPIGNLAVSWHAYNFNACATVSCWDAEVLPVSNTEPLVVTEIGEDDCGSGFIETLMRWLDSHRSGYLPWTWDTGFGCLSLITDYGGTPTQPYGAAFRGHLSDLAQLDRSFGIEGKVTTAVGSVADAASAVALQTDGKIVVGGDSYGSAPDFAVARYNPDGSLDSSFGTGGTVVHSFSPGRDSIFGLAIQPNGKIVTAGMAETTTGNGPDFIVARYNPDGSLDASFGVAGAVLTDFTRSPVNIAADVATSIAIQADGKIVAAGYSNSRNDDFALARYNPDGSLDPSFGSGGKVITDFGGSERIHRILLDSNGRIVAAGDLTGSAALARYMPDGTLDPSFGAAGHVTLNIQSNDNAHAVALEPDGRIVIGGYVNQPLADFALVRVLPDGTVDPSFGSSGRVTTAFGPLNEIVAEVGIQADGKLVATGYSDSGVINRPDQDFALARYNPDGSLDGSFGSGGTVVTDFGLTNEIAQGMTFQRDGRIVAVGYSEDGLGGQTFALARYVGGPPFDTVPGAPSHVTAAAGDATASVSWIAPSSDGGSTILSYEVTASPAVGSPLPNVSVPASGDTTRADVPGLADNTTYRFTVTASNAVGPSIPSTASDPVTPRTNAPVPTTVVDAAPPQGTVTTDPHRVGPTTSTPVTAAVTVPDGGSVGIAIGTVTESAPTGFKFLGQQVDISAPTATLGAPLTLTFSLEGSLVLVPFTDIVVVRTEGGVQQTLGDCPPLIATDPCVSGRSQEAVPPPLIGDVTITVLALSASTWNLAVDDAPPVVTIDAVSRPFMGATGSSTVTWHADGNGPYAVRLGGTDCSTGIVLASGAYVTAPAVVLTPVAASSIALGANTIRVCVTDSALNTGAAVTRIVKDTTAPTVTSVALGGLTPTNAPSITWKVTFSEPVTGVGAANFTLLRVGVGGSPAITGVTGSGALWTVTASSGTGDWALQANLASRAGVTDLAGNPLVNTLTGKVYQIDHVPPTITLTKPAAGAIYTLGGTTNASFACADEFIGSGLGSCTGTTSNGAPIDTTSVGPKTFTVVALDRAGNSTTRNVSYGVIYPFSGFFGSVANPPTVNSVKAGPSVPLVFGLGGNRGLGILPAGSPLVQPINCARHTPTGASAPATGDLAYNSSTGRYTYTWHTINAWAGTCQQLGLVLNDGTTHLAYFRFTK